MAAAPAPETTTLTSEIFLPTSSRPLWMAAAEMMAVPCWSSWNTGMFTRSVSSRSTSKHSGALMSSRLMPPRVGSMAAMMSTSLWVSRSASSMSNTSMPANLRNRQPLPSITGLAASGPMSPRPSTAVPLVTTPTRLPREVYSAAVFGSRLDLQAGIGDAWGVGQRQVALIGQRLGRGNRDLARRRQPVIVERGVGQGLFGRRQISFHGSPLESLWSGRRLCAKPTPAASRLQRSAWRLTVRKNILNRSAGVTESSYERSETPYSMMRCSWVGSAGAAGYPRVAPLKCQARKENQ